ncbi:hypothetical protein SDC9_54235 [bioreactor metagenome]|uniref:Uncharacterized protein n=1 Tax=bioreactor metagenome TaxID=1076179 RepID=A0A644X177_9ZZZZ
MIGFKGEYADSVGRCLLNGEIERQRGFARRGFSADHDKISGFGVEPFVQFLKAPGDVFFLSFVPVDKIKEPGLEVHADDPRSVAHQLVHLCDGVPHVFHIWCGQNGFSQGLDTAEPCLLLENADIGLHVSRGWGEVYNLH